MTDIRAVIDNINNLPTLPDVVTKVNALVTDTKTSASDINDVISGDMSLSARILKIVNSPFYGFSRRITTITYAVVILGFNTVRNLTMSAFVFDAFKAKAGSRRFDLKGFWRHSVGVAVSAKLIAHKLDMDNSEDVFMAGLLHDLGKAIMNEYIKDDLEQVVDKVQAEDCLFLTAEEAALDYNHAAVGGILLEKWNLPAHIVDVVRNHHAPANASESARQACDIVHLADILTRALLIGSGGDHKIPILDPQTWERLGLTWNDVETLMLQIIVEEKKTGEFFE